MRPRHAGGGGGRREWRGAPPPLPSRRDPWPARPYGRGSDRQPPQAYQARYDARGRGYGGGGGSDPDSALKDAREAPPILADDDVPPPGVRGPPILADEDVPPPRRTDSILPAQEGDGAAAATHEPPPPRRRVHILGLPRDYREGDVTALLRVYHCAAAHVTQLAHPDANITAFVMLMTEDDAQLAVHVLRGARVGACPWGLNVEVDAPVPDTARVLHIRVYDDLRDAYGGFEAPAPEDGAAAAGSPVDDDSPTTASRHLPPSRQAAPPTRGGGRRAYSLARAKRVQRAAAADTTPLLVGAAVCLDTMERCIAGAGGAAKGTQLRRMRMGRRKEGQGHIDLWAEFDAAETVARCLHALDGQCVFDGDRGFIECSVRERTEVRVTAEGELQRSYLEEGRVVAIRGWAAATNPDGTLLASATALEILAGVYGNVVHILLVRDAELGPLCLVEYQNPASVALAAAHITGLSFYGQPLVAERSHYLRLPPPDPAANPKFERAFRTGAPEHRYAVDDDPRDVACPPSRYLRLTGLPARFLGDGKALHAELDHCEWVRVVEEGVDGEVPRPPAEARGAGQRFGAPPQGAGPAAVGCGSLTTPLVAPVAAYAKFRNHEDALATLLFHHRTHLAPTDPLPLTVSFARAADARGHADGTSAVSDTDSACAARSDAADSESADVDADAGAAPFDVE